MITDKAELVRWAKDNPEIRRLWNGKYVCSTCGGNCGQCGMTGKFSILNDRETPQPSIARLAKAIEPRLRQVSLMGPWQVVITTILDAILVTTIVCWFLWEALT